MRPVDRWPTPAGWAARDGCTILDCGRPGIARGMCWNHYQRARRGEPVYVYLIGGGTKARIKRFGPTRPPYSFLRMNRLAWEIQTNWTPEPTTGCWLWLGEKCHIEGNEYGFIGGGRDPWGRWAHRAALWFRGVRFERGNRRRQVRHLCNQPACVNPDHIVYGTAIENAADRTARYRRGELINPRPAPFCAPVKLNAGLVQYVYEARLAGASFTELGRDLGVHVDTVKRAVRFASANHQRAA